MLWFFLGLGVLGLLCHVVESLQQTQRDQKTTPRNTPVQPPYRHDTVQFYYDSKGNMQRPL